jgi:hypothetical protein
MPEMINGSNWDRIFQISVFESLQNLHELANDDQTHHDHWPDHDEKVEHVHMLRNHDHRVATSVFHIPPGVAKTC